MPKDLPTLENEINLTGISFSTLLGELTTHFGADWRSNLINIGFSMEGADIKFMAVCKARDEHEKVRWVDVVYGVIRGVEECMLVGEVFRARYDDDVQKLKAFHEAETSLYAKIQTSFPEVPA